MKPLQRRVNNLEASMPSEADVPVIFINFVGAEDVRPNGYECVDQAIIPGSNFGQINRGVGETEDEFRCRVYAMKAANKPIEEMTDEELKIAMAAGSEELAKELAETGEISEESLEGAAGIP